MNHEEIIDNNKEDLVESIEVKITTLWDKLIQLGLFTSSDVEYIKEKYPTERDQVRQMLLSIQKRDVSSYQIFRQALIDNNQGHVVTRFLPEVTDTQPQHASLKTQTEKKNVKDLQQKLAEIYRESYKVDIFCYHDEGYEVDLSDIYVPIQWETRQNTTEGIKEKKLKEYHDVLRKDLSGRPVKVIVKGEPASGKTTFVRKVCKDWSELHLNEDPVRSEVQDVLGSYELLIPVILRLVEHGASLEDTIQEQLALDDGQMLTIHAMLKNTERTVLIMDGLDEYKENTSGEITNIMRGMTFKHIIITTRPESARRCKEWKTVTYKEAKLLGLTDDNIKLYVEKFFKEQIEKRNSLVSHIFQKDSQLIELACNVGSLCMICTLHCDGVPIHSMNREQLYQEYVSFRLSRWEQRQNPEGEKTPRSEILKKYHEILIKFGELADINRKPYDVDGEYKDKSDDEDSMELSFTSDQIKSVIGESIEDILDYGLIYRSHPASRLVKSQFSFKHKTLHEYFLAYFISNTDIEPFKQSLCKNQDLLKQELSLTRFLLHLYMSPEQAFEFTTNIIGSEPDVDLFIVLLKLYQGYQHDEHQTTLTFNTTEEDILDLSFEYSYIYQYPCYVLRADCEYHHQDSLSSFNKDLIRRMNTDNKHKAVTVPILQTAIGQVITCKHWSGCDFAVYCRADYEVTVTGDCSKLEGLYLDHIEKMGDINLHYVNDRLKVNIEDTNLHGCGGLTKPWMALIHSLRMGCCKLEAGDISVIADNIQACTSPTGAESASSCRLQKLDLSHNSLTGSGANIARIISCIPLCTGIVLAVCDLNDEDFHAIVNAIIQTHSDRHTSVHDHSASDGRQTSRIKPASPGPASHIEELWLNQNKFSDIETLRLLLDSLPPSLRELYLLGNQFNEETHEMTRTYKDNYINLDLLI